ncbi:hypothetical protein KUTeg_000603, partial [Tegillarca granosa]
MVRLLHKIFQRQSVTQLSIWIYKRHFRTTTLRHSHEHVVIVSKSNNIYTNLALEEWLYENEDLSKKSILLLWKNQPTVVIGRHQNPWLECNVEEIVDSGIDLARRSSGGGTVYHDEGNLNCSFIKERKLYNRKWNLGLVVDTVTSAWDIDLSLNSREDIVLDKLYKKSHFQWTSSDLYFDIHVGVKSKATQSLPSAVKNISDYVDVDFTSLVTVIGQQLKDWEWIYGKSPKFTINKIFTKTINSELNTLTINIEINKGRISDVEIDISPIICQRVNGFGRKLAEKFVNVKFWKTDLDNCIHDILRVIKTEEYNDDFDI